MIQVVTIAHKMPVTLDKAQALAWLGYLLYTDTRMLILPSKYAGLGIPDPSFTSEDNYEVSTLVCSHSKASRLSVPWNTSP
jgi:hypothetical protein